MNRGIHSMRLSARLAAAGGALALTIAIVLASLGTSQPIRHLQSASGFSDPPPAGTKDERSGTPAGRERTEAPAIANVEQQLGAAFEGRSYSQTSEVSVSRPLAEAGAEMAAAYVPPAEPIILERGLTKGLPPDAAPAPEAPASDDLRAPSEPRIPGSSRSFDGIKYGDSGASSLPPDPSGAVGPNHYVEVTNRSMAIFNRAGALLGGPFPTSSVWLGFTSPCGTSNMGDVVVLYDRMADRWFFAELAFNWSSGFPVAPFVQCVAVSSSPDPLGTWNRYQFVSPTGQLIDYPKFGIWSDGYYMSANLFDPSTLPPTHVGMLGGAMERSKMLAGLPAQFVATPGSPVISELMPADIDGAVSPPPGVGGPFVTILDSAAGYPFDLIATYRYNVSWTSPASGSPSVSGVLPVAPFSPLVCPTVPNCANQPTSAVKLNVVPYFAMFRAAYRNFGDHEAIVINNTIDVGGGRPGIRWYEIRGISGTTTLFQQGNHAPGTDDYWLASMATDGAGGIGMGYSRSSIATFPSVEYTGRLQSDPVGSMAQGTSSIQGGSGSQSHSSGRWGDYSQMSVDPTDDCTFWYVNEYYAFTTSVGWRTRVGSFKLPGCTTSPPNPPSNVATRPEDEQVSIFWDNPVTSTAGVRIVRKAGPVPPSEVTDGVTVFDGYATTYTDVGLTNGTLYSYALFAHNGLPAYSTPASASATPATHGGLSYTAYLAEGYTGSQGFLSSEYLTIGNVDPVTPSTVIATYLIQDAAPIYKTYVVAPSSRLTIFVNNEIGTAQSNGVRLAVKSGPGVVAERPMYFSGSPGVAGVNGGHDSVASPKPRSDWYFAEGYTGAGFVEYLSLLNPSGNSYSTVQATYVFASGSPIVKTYSVPPGQRFTVNVGGEVGTGRDVSTHLAVISGSPIVAERPMYFNANPLLGAVVNDGHVYMGAAAPGTTWYFAEGYTGAGFVEWLTLQNPGGSPSEVTATYSFNSGPPLIKSYTLPSNSRTSLLVNNEIGAPGRDVAVRLDSSAPIVAERPMYFKANPALGAVVDGGHDVVGATSTGGTNVLAEGYTGAGFVEWLTLQNPTAITSTVDITYLFNTGPPLVDWGRVLPPNSRTTIRVNSVVGDGKEVSVKVQTTSGANPIVERPMYFNANPALGTTVNGGHDVVASTVG